MLTLLVQFLNQELLLPTASQERCKILFLLIKSDINEMQMIIYNYSSLLLLMQYHIPIFYRFHLLFKAK